MLIAVWTLIGAVIAGGVAAFGLLRGTMRDLEAKITGLDTKFTGEFAQVRSDITRLAESVGHIQGTLDEHLRRHDTHAVGT